MKLLKLNTDEIYHVFCLALCISCVDGVVSDREAEMLTRIGFSLGLSPEDISALSENAKAAIAETSIADVIAFSLATLKAQLSADQLRGVKYVLRFVSGGEKNVSSSEEALLELVNEIWKD